MNDKIHSYLETIIPNRSPLLMEMEQFALENNVPIMECPGIDVLIQLLRIQQPACILEIGTAIGYSALRMAEALPNTKIISIERDEARLNQAKAYIARSKHANQISIICGDALEVSEQVSTYAPFDMIFIDAAKGQYQKFFELYTPYLSKTGIVLSDNVLFKGLVAEGHIEHKRTRKLVEKIDAYNKWLMNHEQFVTSIIPVGDGLAVSKKN